MRFMDIRWMTLGMAPALVGRVTFTGDLGYEIWCKSEYHRYLFDELMRAGEPHGIRLFGSRALNALRLEKNFGGWARRVPSHLRPGGSGSRPLRRLRQGGRLHRQGGGAGRTRKREGSCACAPSCWKRRTPMRSATSRFGWTARWSAGLTSGGYAHHSKASVALGYVPREVAEQDSGWEIRASRGASPRPPPAPRALRPQTASACATEASRAGGGVRALALLTAWERRQTDLDRASAH